MAIEELAARIPEHLFERSGKVFYSGRDAFSNVNPLYMLGVNPGDSPDGHASETVSSHTSAVLHALPSNWSAYRDESWQGAEPGTYGMAPRVLHLLRRLDMDPGAVPSSNLVFVRSRREGEILRSEMTTMADACWSFHQNVIARLLPRVVLCFGQTAGKYLRRRLEANILVDEFIENNNRKWRSQAFLGTKGIKVVIATHPSVANWCADNTDITPLVQKALT